MSGEDYQRLLTQLEFIAAQSSRDRESNAVVLARLDHAKCQCDDHEVRLRLVESAVIRHAIYASIGSMVGATILATAIEMLAR